MKKSTDELHAEEGRVERTEEAERKAVNAVRELMHAKHGRAWTVAIVSSDYEGEGASPLVVRPI